METARVRVRQSDHSFRVGTSVPPLSRTERKLIVVKSSKISCVSRHFLTPHRSTPTMSCCGTPAGKKGAKQNNRLYSQHSHYPVYSISSPEPITFTLLIPHHRETHSAVIRFKLFLEPHALRDARAVDLRLPSSPVRVSNLNRRPIPSREMRWPTAFPNTYSF